MAYAAAIAAIASAGIGAAGQIGGAAASGGGGGGTLGPDEIMNLLAVESRSQPGNYSSGLNQLEAQSAFGLGASPDSLALEILTRQIEVAKNPLFARRFQQAFQNAQSLMMLPVLTPQQQKLLDKNMQQINSILTTKGGGASVYNDNGQLRIRFADAATQNYIDAARAQSESIRQARLAGQAKLSQIAGDFPAFTATDLKTQQDQILKQVQDEINAQYDLQGQNLLQSANIRGFNPAGTLGELEKQRIRDLNAAPTTAADRALQILSGQQGLAANSIAGINQALAPDQQIAIMNALRGQQTPTTGQLAAAQIGASAQLAAQNSKNQAGLIAGASGSLQQGGRDLAGILMSQNPGAGTQ